MGVHPKRLCTVRGFCQASQIAATHDLHHSRKRLTILDKIADGEPYPAGHKQTDYVNKQTMSISESTLKAQTSTPEKALKFAAKLGLIANQKTCHVDQCDEHMNLIKSSSEVDGYYWQCRRCKDKSAAKKSVRDGSIFSAHRTSIATILHLFYTWANSPKLSLSDLVRRHHISEPIVIDWYVFLRNVCEEWVDSHRSAHNLGGQGRVVEIDESLFYRCKYNRGRLVPELWVFGLIERGSDDVYMEIAPKRDRDTLLPIVEKHVAPDTTIISDAWRAYLGIPALSKNNTHKWVNHKVCFVDPFDDDVHTQSIEATWGGVKRTLKHLSGTSKNLFPTYLYNYMFRRAHRNRNIFEHILFWTSLFYNPN